MFRRLPTFLSLTFAATVGLFALSSVLLAQPPAAGTDPDKIKGSQEENLKLFKKFSEEVLRLATDNDKRTEGHAYMGLALRLKGERDEARANFEWVKQYGNKRFYEYPLAIEELKRLAR